MAQKPVAAHRKWLREHKEKFVKEHKDKGTFKKAWKDKIRDDLLKDQSDTTKNAYVEAMLIAADTEWEDDHENPYDPRQLEFAFTIAGHGIQKYVTFFDPFVPGKHRKVSGEFATNWHLQQSLDLKRKKLEQATAAFARDEAAAAAALQRSEGNLFARLWEFRDGQANAA